MFKKFTKTFAKMYITYIHGILKLYLRFYLLNKIHAHKKVNSKYFSVLLSYCRLQQVIKIKLETWILRL